MAMTDLNAKASFSQVIDESAEFRNSLCLVCRSLVMGLGGPRVVRYRCLRIHTAEPSRRPGCRSPRHRACRGPRAKTCWGIRGEGEGKRRCGERKEEKEDEVWGNYVVPMRPTSRAE